MPALPNPLALQFALPEHISQPLLHALHAGSTQKSRTIPLTPADSSPVQLSLIQPGTQTPKSEAVITCSVDLPSLIAPGGFTTNVIRPFIEPVLQQAKRQISSVVPLSARADVESVSIEQVEILRLPFTFLFKFPAPSDALDALHGKLFKHLKVTLDCAGRFPGARQSKSAPVPRISTISTQRHAYRAELVHPPSRAPFAEARLSIAWDGWDLPDAVREGTTTERIKLRDLLRTIVRIDISLETRRHFPIGLDTFLQVPADDGSLALFKDDFLENVFTGFRWATWINEPFANSADRAELESQSAALAEMLKWHFDGKDLARHYLVQNDHDQLLKFRRLLIREAMVDPLNPWEAARLGEAPWLHSAFDYSRRLDPAAHPLLTPYCLTSGNLQKALAALAR